MMGVRHRSSFDKSKIKRAAHKGSITSIGHASGSIRKDAQKSIKTRTKADGSSPEGDPPFTRRGRIKKAILYNVDKRKEASVIGSTASRMDRAAKPHEHGGRYKGTKYKKRPFMFPALIRVMPRLPSFWEKSLR